MNGFTLTFGKASQSKSPRLSRTIAKWYSTAPATVPSNGNSTSHTPADAVTQRELFMNVLNANATKRDAKQYLARFKPAKPPQKKSTFQSERSSFHAQSLSELERIGVNLGSLYTPARAIAQSPQFVRAYNEEEQVNAAERVMHVALVCLRNPKTIDDETLDGVALTLSQLVKLDMRIAIVLDTQLSSSSLSTSHVNVHIEIIREQMERLTKAIGKHSLQGAHLVNGAIEEQQGAAVRSLEVALPRLITEPLKRSTIPVIPTLAYTEGGRIFPTTASKVMEALTRSFCGFSKSLGTPTSSSNTKDTTLDRIIILDTVGGIPSKARGGGSHVFINLEQEFNDISRELDEYDQDLLQSPDSRSQISGAPGKHRSNLYMLRQCLAMLPSASSGLIITPEEAASASQSANRADTTIGTGTRRQKNPLVHNLLTNKPMISSSLPTARMPSVDIVHDETAGGMPTSTLVKRGMPVTIIPTAPHGSGWKLPAAGTTGLDLSTDPRVDLPRLVHLINDSFRRELDLQHYLNRVQSRIAGLVIAGSYEGAAVLTWEQPPGTSDPARLVPYLDKFAVLSSSQGSSGVADILFQAMVRTCFPNGVCWRSRQDNPVNKWYFERADGHWQIPGSNWTMFWTGEGVVEDQQRWDDYVSVCESIGASWLDGKKPD